MSFLGFEKETLLDLTVNAIPLGILIFFFAAYAVVPAFGFDPVFSSMMFAIIGTMFLGLAILTYYTGKAIEGAEKNAAEESVE